MVLLLLPTVPSPPWPVVRSLAVSAREHPEPPAWRVSAIRSAVPGQLKGAIYHFDRKPSEQCVNPINNPSDEK